MFKLIALLVAFVAVASAQYSASYGSSSSGGYNPGYYSRCFNGRLLPAYDSANGPCMLDNDCVTPCLSTCTQAGFQILSSAQCLGGNSYGYSKRAIADEEAGYRPQYGGNNNNGPYGGNNQYGYGGNNNNNGPYGGSNQYGYGGNNQQQSYGYAQPTYGYAPQYGYGQQQSYGYSQPTYGYAPQYGYGQQQSYGYGAPQYGYGQQYGSYGTSSWGGYGQPQVEHKSCDCCCANVPTCPLPAQNPPQVALLPPSVIGCQSDAECLSKCLTSSATTNGACSTVKTSPLVLSAFCVFSQTAQGITGLCYCCCNSP